MQDWGQGALRENRENFTKHEKVKLSVEDCGQKTYTLQKQRIALEQDVSKLQKKLKQEINIRIAFERAFRRNIGALPRLPPYLPAKIQKLLAEVAVLEEEIIKLEENVVSLRQGFYNEAVYVSLSKKQKNQMIEADKSPLVKGTYVGKCMKKQGFPYARNRQKRTAVVTELLPPVKKDGNPGARLLRVTSISQKSNPERDTTDLIHHSENLKDSSSNICNSSWSPFSEVENRRPKLKENQKQLASNSQIIRSEIFSGNPNMDLGHFGKIIKKKPCDKRQQELIKEAPPFAPNRTFLTFSKDENNQEANRLSEEMLRCLLTIYLKLTKPVLSDYDASSTISQSTFSSFRSYGSSSVSCRTSVDVSDEIYIPDPYGILIDSTPRDIGPYRHYHYIKADSFINSRLTSSNGLVTRLRMLLDKLSVVNLQGLTHQQKLAFWINIYNACMMHAFLEHGIPGSPDKIVALMRKAALTIGGHRLNALAIEHFILRLPSNPKNAYLRCGKEDVFKRGPYSLEWPEPLVSFALSCGSHSSPAVRVYTASEVTTELEIAMKEYLQAAVGVSIMKKVTIPKLLDWYMRDFAKDAESLIEWVCEQLPSFLCSSVHECMEGSQERRALSQIVESKLHALFTRCIEDSLQVVMNFATRWMHLAFITHQLEEIMLRLAEFHSSSMSSNQK